jgi:hypothetical protein
LDVKGTYKDYSIEIYMAFGGAIYLTSNTEMPIDVFKQLE